MNEGEHAVCSNDEHEAVGSNASHAVLGNKSVLEHSKALEQVQRHSRVLVLVLARSKVQERVPGHSMVPELGPARSKVQERVPEHSMVPALELARSKVLVRALEHSMVPARELVRSMVLEPVLGSKVPELACSNERGADGSNAHASDGKPNDREGSRVGQGSKQVQGLHSSLGQTGQLQLGQRLLLPSQQQPAS